MEQELQEKFNQIIKDLFGSTEHFASEGEVTAINWIIKLIDRGYISLEDLLRVIGQHYQPKL